MIDKNGIIVYVTGHKSGLGRYLVENLPNTVKFDVLNGSYDTLPKNCNKVLLLCGFTRITPHEEIEFSVLQKNVYDLLKICGHKFNHIIYLSSIDVYPKLLNFAFDETYRFLNQDIYSVYQYQKLLSEKTILNVLKAKTTILRLPALIGRNSKPNSIIKVFNGQRVGLTPNSNFHVLSYSEVSKIIYRVVDNKMQGIFNCTTGESFTLSELANIVNQKPKFGDHEYITPNLVNQKILTNFEFKYLNSIDYVFDELDQKS